MLFLFVRNKINLTNTSFLIVLCKSFSKPHEPPMDGANFVHLMIIAWTCDNPIAKL